VLRRYLERHGLLPCFTAVSFSDEIGVRKPDAEIFRRTLAKLGSAPGETAHVGDNPIADVEGSRRVGLRAVHYTAGRRSPAAGADLVVADLASLPDRLAAL
jgi:FMN phosphatase YigB (HAD superfamily)